jgi:ferredoxin, 2Fe-2S
MVKIIFRDHTGHTRDVEAEDGSTVMEAAIRNGIPGILAECGGACACATCHVYVDEAFMPLVGEPAPMEEDMLDFAFDVRPNSRLSCQVRVRENLDGLIVTTPQKQA